jgi:hypothetical protein
MPNGPSQNARNCLITFLQWAPASPQDSNAGAATGPSAYTTIIVSELQVGIHLVSSTEVEDQRGRPSIMNSWAISMNENVGLKLKDKGMFVMDNVTHEVYVSGFQNRSGRNHAYKVFATETT